ncbi:uncharacterized protein [Amphiura filiformis]|uniref:uncharacterized protein n=1 Tax=Amphiura filiformis TaxID=82378 RepID=UPI003B216B72
MAGWDYGLCGCFSNIGLCLVAYFVPCYIVGKTAETVGSSCCCCCILWLFIYPFVTCHIRGKVRANKEIGGGVCSDFFCSLFLPCLVIPQMAQEMSVHAFGAGESMARV